MCVVLQRSRTCLDKFSAPAPICFVWLIDSAPFVIEFDPLHLWTGHSFQWLSRIRCKSGRTLPGVFHLYQEPKIAVNMNNSCCYRLHFIWPASSAAAAAVLLLFPGFVIRLSYLTCASFAIVWKTMHPTGQKYIFALSHTRVVYQAIFGAISSIENAQWP